MEQGACWLPACHRPPALGQYWARGAMNQGAAAEEPSLWAALGSLVPNWGAVPTHAGDALVPWPPGDRSGELGGSSASEVAFALGPGGFVPNLQQPDGAVHAPSPRTTGRGRWGALQAETARNLKRRDENLPKVPIYYSAPSPPAPARPRAGARLPPAAEIKVPVWGRHGGGSQAPRPSTPFSGALFPGAGGGCDGCVGSSGRATACGPQGCPPAWGEEGARSRQGAARSAPRRAPPPSPAPGDNGSGCPNSRGCCSTTAPAAPIHTRWLLETEARGGQGWGGDGCPRAGSRPVQRHSLATATHGTPAGGTGKAASQNGVFITAIHHRGGLMWADGSDFSSWFTDK